MPATTIDASEKSQSRMRAHKGNVPSLPQTKYCSLCPAKFTRTTHLNRHLRSHTNERLHRCNICKSAEFTRSDLLTRHKRTCGQSVNRSRRKSCEACAESKIKCNLEYPCAKCTSRGRECIFQNDPEESRNKSSSKAASRKYSASPKPADDSRSTTPPPQDPSSSRTRSSSPSSLSLNLPALSESGSSDSSIHSSPRSEGFQTFDEQFDFPFVGLYDDPNPTLSPFDQTLFPSPAFISSATAAGLDDSKADSGGSDGGHPAPPIPLSVDHDMNLFTSLLQTPDPPPSAAGAGFMSQPTVTLDCLDAIDMRCMSGPSSAEHITNTYLHLFFSRFLAQVPLIHAPTWNMEDTPPILARIFHACGALFVKTSEAAAFVAETLTSVTAEISVEFSTVNETSADLHVSRHHTHLILALVLLQTICLFRREGAALAPTNDVQHHAMLVAMIRQTGLIRRVGSWTAPDWSDPITMEAAWTEWVNFATIKRALLLAYFHDCCHCMYSASPPAFSPAELDVHLPCDDALWRARTAAEWFRTAHTPSPYGVGVARLYGVSMQHALTTLAKPTNPSASPDETNTRLALTPFALFLLIHTVLRNISVAQRAPPPGGWSCFALVAAPGVVDANFTFRTQVVLDNWLQLWLTSPEATMPQATGTTQEPPFVCNSLPFYWLAQVSLWETSGTGPVLDLAPYHSNLSPEVYGNAVGPLRSILNSNQADPEESGNTGSLLEEMAVDLAL
ncbi:fungal-specific transcription factor domain-containing protein [Mycena crocata]|nr:fungal-specific transcription factor domain-containing protein [Mycena crocata]